MGRRASGSRASRPKIRAVPAVGWTADSSAFTNVVFPAPLGPRRPKIVPRGTRREMPSTARTSRRFQRERYTFVRPDVWIAYSESTKFRIRDRRWVVSRGRKGIEGGARRLASPAPVFDAL